MNFGDFSQRLRLRREFSREHLAVTVDHRNQIIKIMSDPTSQPSDGFESLGVVEHFLQVMLFGGVPISGHDMGDFAFTIFHGTEYPCGVERGIILAP